MLAKSVDVNLKDNCLLTKNKTSDYGRTINIT